jgi:2-polyprenyl-6-methoxyphenol hydroxylase-like FAD-dependent oxidoreductase
LPYAELGLPQYETERLLAAHLAGYRVEVERGVTLTGLTQSDNAVIVRLAREGKEEEEARFRYVIGCDGAHSWRSFCARTIALACFFWHL